MIPSDMLLVKEFPRLLAAKHPLRVYRASECRRWRWFFGFPRALVKPLCPLLETTPFWAHTHIGEADDFWIWQLYVLEPSPDPDWDRLTGELRFLLRLYNMCLGTMKKWTHGSEV